jgi:hypothetical protein
MALLGKLGQQRWGAAAPADHKMSQVKLCVMLQQLEGWHGLHVIMYQLHICYAC